jgi:hypothetical protein
MANLTDKRTASQRIEDLERAVMSIFQVSNNMSRENSMIKDALQLLGSRVTALIQVLAGGQVVSEDSVDLVMKINQIGVLKEKVKNLIDQGFLEATDSIVEGTFVIGTENEPDQADGTPGKVVHPRLQFTLASMEKDIQAKLTGAKVGSVVTFKENALVFKVEEIYKIVAPTPPSTVVPNPENAPTETTPTVDASAPAAPATDAPAATQGEQSSSDAAQAAPAASTDQAAGN